jgi:hypothetical protein
VDHLVGLHSCEVLHAGRAGALADPADYSSLAARPVARAAGVPHAATTASGEPIRRTLLIARVAAGVEGLARAERGACRRQDDRDDLELAALAAVHGHRVQS